MYVFIPGYNDGEDEKDDYQFGCGDNEELKELPVTSTSHLPSGAVFTSGTVGHDSVVKDLIELVLFGDLFQYAGILLYLLDQGFIVEHCCCEPSWTRRVLLC